LTPGIHRKQANVAMIAAQLDVNAAGEPGGVFREQEFPRLHVATNAIGICAVAIEDGVLDDKSGVDQASERIRIIILAKSNAETAAAGAKIR
jgi:hypothetical protein